MAIPNPTGETDPKNNAQNGADKGLISFIVPKVQHSRQVRDHKHGKRWREFTRMWRGFFDEKDKTGASERSKLIAPALSQAIEMTAAEIEEAIFGRQAWFDLSDDLADQLQEDEEGKQKIIRMRDQLLEDFELEGVPTGISEAILLGTIYGTGIGKIHVSRKKEPILIGEPSQGGDIKKETRVRIGVQLEAIRPDEFVIDEAATSIDEAAFVAHEVWKPIHSVRAKMGRQYRKREVAAASGTKGDTTGTGRDSTVSPQDGAVLITEFFGKVPKDLIPEAKEEDVERGMVEAIVTLANEGTVLRAVPNPFIMKDRPIIAYQHDTVPGEFWGRSVSEKGINALKALNTELRARSDALAFMTAPMMGADITRMPKNIDTSVRPGRTILTRGRPSEVLEPVTFGDPRILGATFQQAADLERMIQVGTGAMDSAIPTKQNRRNETASGMSMMQGSFIKRSKRTMQNLERKFLNPLIRKAMWRYVQFDPERYPQDITFVSRSTLGIMAQEVENTQLINMLGFVPQDSPAHGIILKAIFENTASANKKELADAIAIMTKPPTEEENQQAEQMKQLQLVQAQAEAQKTSAEAQKAESEARLALARAQGQIVEADFKDEELAIQAVNAATGAEKIKQQASQLDVQAQNSLRDMVKAISELLQQQTDRESTRDTEDK